MKIAFVSLPVAGHLNPMSALAAKVQSDGNEVVFISVADAEARAVAAGLRFVAYRNRSPTARKHQGCGAAIQQDPRRRGTQVHV